MCGEQPGRQDSGVKMDECGGGCSSQGQGSGERWPGSDRKSMKDRLGGGGGTVAISGTKLPWKRGKKHNCVLSSRQLRSKSHHMSQSQGILKSNYQTQNGTHCDGA